MRSHGRHHAHSDSQHHGSTAAGAITGTDGNDQLTGTAANEKLFGGAGNDTMTGGGGRDEFVFGGNSGQDEITDFNAGGPNAGIIDLRHAGLAVTGFADLMTHVSEVNGNAVVDLGNGNSITLDKVDMTTLTADNFELPGQGGHGGPHGDHGKGGHGDHGGGTGTPATKTDLAPVIGTTGDDKLTATDANSILIGRGGNDNLTGGAGNDVLAGGAGNDTLNGGAGNDTLHGCSGNDMLTGGAGNDVFVIGGNHGTPGNTEITDFTVSGAGADVVRLEHSAIQVTGFADLLTHFTQTGANAVLDLGAGNTLTLDNVQVSDLTAADFILS